MLDVGDAKAHQSDLFKLDGSYEFNVRDKFEGHNCPSLNHIYMELN